MGTVASGDGRAAGDTVNEPRLLGDPILVAGTLVGGRFAGRGFVIREGFEQHPRVVHWLRKWGTPRYTVEPRHGFEQLTHDGVGA